MKQDQSAAIVQAMINMAIYMRCSYFCVVCNLFNAFDALPY